ncbi:MAG: ABC transporter ATP-binding protein [Microbacteriaceae bacterium]|nr:ABC transporter ATP-binding protein [Microbacteriaceae bacterium]
MSAERAPRQPGPVVDIRELRVAFATDGGDVVAVDGVSLQVQPGEILAIVGESGSGKTVTARSILGLLPETAALSGQVIVAGDDVASAPPRELRAIRGVHAAMVFQEPSSVLNPVYTVGWQIAEGLRAHGKVSRRAARAQAIEMLRRVGIPEPEARIDYFPHQFSGGQKQRIVIAMALILGPAVIVADEPTTALDVTVQAQILRLLLRRCRDEFGATVVLITHNMGVVADLADRVIVMNGGRIVEEAPVERLFAQPADAYTQQLLAAVPRLSAGPSWSPARAERVEGRERAQAQAPVVRAEHLRIEYPGRLGRKPFVAVPDASFEIAPGEVLGLVGESGSGKTTIGRAMARLAPVSGGSLEVLGVDLAEAGERRFRPQRRRLGFVFQDPGTSFNPLMTIGHAIAEPIQVHGTAEERAGARQRVEELLEAVRLPRAYADRFPHELSGGQRQRASLARGLILGPDLLIADEPTSALDVSVQAAVLELFGELRERFGFASLFITHDLAVVDQVADRVIVLYKGEIVEEGPTSAVLHAPTEPYTQRLLASLPVPDPVAQRARRAARSA